MIPLTLHSPNFSVYRIDGHEFVVRFDALRVPGSDGVMSVACRGIRGGRLNVQWVGMFRDGGPAELDAIQFALNKGWLQGEKLRIDLGANAYKSPTEFQIKPSNGTIGWFFDRMYGEDQIVVNLAFHADFFRRLGVVPLLNPFAQRLLIQREKELGMEFAPALREFLILRDAPRLYSGECVLTPPLEELGKDASDACPFAKLYSDDQGQATFFVRLDNADSGDTDVYIAEHPDDDFDECGRPVRVYKKFTEFILEQLEYSESWSTVPIDLWADSEQRSTVEIGWWAAFKRWWAAFKQGRSG